MNSPFAGITGPNQSYNPKNVHATSDAWAETYFDKQPTNADVAYTADKYKTSDGYLRIVTASDIAAYYGRMALTFFPGERDVKPGDLCFFYKTNDDGTLVYPKRYYGISHVGLMISDSKFLNITSYPASGNLIVTNVTARAPFLYARPLYGSITRGASGDLTAGVTNLIPDVPSGIPQGTSNNNGLTITMTGKKMSLSGKPTSGMTKTFVSKSCPIELPPGTYKLSGFVNGTGTNTKNPNHSMWGLRVYNADTGDGIAGTTTSSNGRQHGGQNPSVGCRWWGNVYANGNHTDLYQYVADIEYGVGWDFCQSDSIPGIVGEENGNYTVKWERLFLSVGHWATIQVPEGVPTVHFKMHGEGVAFQVVDRMVAVPDELLQLKNDIILWTYDTNHTIDVARIPVKKRNKPPTTRTPPRRSKRGSSWTIVSRRWKKVEWLLALPVSMAKPERWC